MNNRGGLEATSGTALLVDVAESFRLLALLQQAGHGNNEQSVDGDHAEDGREDVVDKVAGERRERGSASDLQCRGCLAGAEGAGSEGGRLAVFVATAAELLNRKDIELALPTRLKIP